jgi:hypothetical protein
MKKLAYKKRPAPIEDFGRNLERPTFLSDGAIPHVSEGSSPKGPVESPRQSKTQWLEPSGGIFAACGPSRAALPDGVYSVEWDGRNERAFYVTKALVVDDLIRFDGGLIEDVLKEIALFWGIGDRFREMGVLHRRGYLFYGPPGSGKTCLVNLILNDLVARHAVVLVCGGGTNMSIFSQGVQELRQVEPKRQIVCLFEDIDEIVRKQGEAEMLSLLDGENQIDGVLQVATTNYPENLDRRIVGRPRRFDRIHKIDHPAEAVRREYFRRKMPMLTALEADRWVEETAGLSLAALAELAISVRCLGNSFEDSLEILRGMSERKYSSTEANRAAGFNGGNGKEHIGIV